MQQLPYDYLDNRQSKSQSVQSKIGKSAYVVNNSFFSSLKPKRASFDIKIYLQLHRKLVRKAVIQKKFQENAYQINGKVIQQRKGFRGKRKPDTFLCNTSTSRTKQRRTYTEQQSTYYNQTGQHWHEPTTKSLPQQSEQIVVPHSSINTRNKPNMMYNLSLYRRGFKHSNFKRQRVCETIMQNIQRTRRVLTRQCSSKRSKMLTTIS